MFTSLGQLFSTTPPRRIENTDTRQTIQRHDPDHERRKKKKHDELENTDLFSTHDIAMVSVEALQAFLDNFLKEQKITGTFEQKAHEGEIQKTVSPVSKDKMPLQNKEESKTGANSYAAQAYQNMQTKLDVHRFDKLSDPKAMPALGLSTQDIRAIHKLRDDLEILADQKIEFIKIEQNLNFLNALVTAVDQEIQNII